MDIKPLAGISLKQITACFNEAFSQYLVKFNATEDYLRWRWYCARVDYQLSFGAFEGDHLLGFIITCVDEWQGQRTAFNAGTGVIPSHWGQGITGKIYEQVIESGRRAGIHQYTLEVITSNVPAVKAYQKVGFSVDRKLKCFHGTIPALPPRHKPYDWHIRRVQLPDWPQYRPLAAFRWAWESTDAAVERMADNAVIWEMIIDGGLQAYCVFDLLSNKLIQWGAVGEMEKDYLSVLFKSTLSELGEIRVNNIDESAIASWQLVTALGFTPSVEQYEMKYILS